MYIREFLINVLNSVGLQFWWPVDIKYHKITGGYWEFEVILGAILTQNTKWRLVEKNIEFLKNKKLIFDEHNILKLELEDIKVPMKKRKLNTIKNFFKFFIENFSNIREFKEEDKEWLRDNILKIKGIGNETADVIILYAAEKPEMVVDSYTTRLLYLNNFIKSPNISYKKLKDILEAEIKKDLEKIVHLLTLKAKTLDIKKTLKEKYNASMRDRLPLNPFDLLKTKDYNKQLTIVYKEIHAALDEYYKKYIKNK